MKRFFHSRAYQKRLKRLLTEKRLDHDFKIQSMAVILDTSLGITPDFFEEYARELKISPQKIEFLFFPPQTFPEQENHLYFQPKALGFFGKLPQELTSFCDNEVDLLLNFHQANDLYMNWMSCEKKHKFSVGFLPTQENLNDLIFAFSPNQLTVFREELTKYLRQLNKL